MLKLAIFKHVKKYNESLVVKRDVNVILYGGRNVVQELVRSCLYEEAAPVSES